MSAGDKFWKEKQSEGVTGLGKQDCVRKGLLEKVTFDPEGSEGTCQAWGRSVLDGEKCKYKDLMGRVCSDMAEKQEASVAGVQ